MKQIKPIYSSPKLEIVPFEEEDILTISTNDSVDTGTAPVIGWGDLGWT